MTITSRSTLQLPRQLVNKILAHAQQHENQRICGVVSVDSQTNYCFYPLTPSLAELSNSPCFDENNTGFNAIQAKLARKQQNLFACVFSITCKSDELSANNGLFPQDQCYYIVTSLNTKGVIDMQGYYRENNTLQKVGLTLQQE